MRSVAEVTTTVPAWLTARAAPSPTSTTGSDWRSAAVTRDLPPTVSIRVAHTPPVSASTEASVPPASWRSPTEAMEIRPLGSSSDVTGLTSWAVLARSSTAITAAPSWTTSSGRSERSAKTTLSSWLIGLLIRP